MSPNHRPAAIVMTATITPREGMPDSVRNDPKIRLDDYRRALEFYLSLPNSLVDRILFLENSSSDLSVLRRVVESLEHDKKVEFNSFTGDYQPEFGKGYGEFQMLDYGLSECRFLSKADVVWKVTGRHRVLNLSRLIETAPQDYTVYCDLRSIPFIGGDFNLQAVPFIGKRLGEKYRNQFMDLRVFSCTVDGYDRLLRNQYLQMWNQMPEKFLFDVMFKAKRQEKRIVPRFRIQPQIAGYAGWDNADYQSLSYKIKDSFRAAMRLVMPGFWV